VSTKSARPGVPDVLFSAVSSEWETPPQLFARIEARYGPFDLDPAATLANAKAPIFYTAANDGLKLPWNHYGGERPGRMRHGRVFLNPPYGRGVTQLWIEKVIAELENPEGVESVTCLLKADTDQPWWHDGVMRRAHEVIFLRGRVHFVGAPSGAPFRSAVVWFHWLDWPRGNFISPLPRFYAGLDDTALPLLPLTPGDG